MKRWCIEVRNNDDQVIFQFFLNLKEMTSDEKSEATNPKTESSNINDGKHNEKGELLMVEKQKKELFRLSAEKGYENEEIHKKLLDYFGVEILKDATYSQAQKLIDKMQEDKEKKE